MSTETRFLTPEEIEYVLSDCVHRGLTREQNATVTASALKPIRDSLEKVEVYPEIIPKLKETITTKFHKSRVEPGSSVGIIMGQVLGEDQTQAKLNAFHQAGLVLRNVISGVPRFNELLIASTHPKGQLTSIYFKNPPTSITAARELVGTDLQQITVDQLTDGTDYHFSETGFSEPWYSLFEEFFEEYLPENFSVDQYRYRMVLRLDPHSMVKWNLTQVTVIEALMDVPDTVAMFSPTVDLEIHVFLDKEFHPVSWIGELHSMYQKVISTVVVAGIAHVETLHFKRETEDSDRWMALCEGERITRGNMVRSSVNRFIEILSLDYVDQFLTISNNIWDVCIVYGIEAVRELMIYEFLACGEDVYGKNSRHVELLVDIMLFTGRITAVSKNGVNPETAQVLLRASFEQVIPQFASAAVYTETDNVESISAGMMCGTICNVGTAINSLILSPSG